MEMKKMNKNIRLRDNYVTTICFPRGAFLKGLGIIVPFNTRTCDSIEIYFPT